MIDTHALGLKNGALYDHRFHLEHHGPRAAFLYSVDLVVSPLLVGDRSSAVALAVDNSSTSLPIRHRRVHSGRILAWLVCPTILGFYRVGCTFVPHSRRQYQEPNRNVTPLDPRGPGTSLMPLAFLDP